MRLEIREETLLGAPQFGYELHCDEHDFHGVRWLKEEQSADPQLRYLAIFDLMEKMWGDDRCGCRDLPLLARFNPKAVAS